MGWLLQARPAHAEERQLRLGFSNLVLRTEHETGIAIAPDEYRVYLLERLRALGFEAVGAESLVFSKDESKRAELVLGGTIRRLQCRQGYRIHYCRIAIHWEVLDVAVDSVRYEVTTTSAVYDNGDQSAQYIGRKLVVGALESLGRRSKFRELLSSGVKADPAVAYPEASFKRCTATAEALPKGANAAMAATVIVEVGEGFGSGFHLSDDGLIVTAAHVVETGKITIRERDGSRYEALVVRSNKPSDMALLRPVQPRATRCLPLDERSELMGADVYVIGSPASRELAFSMTRGIVSGARTFEGVQFWQTDASVNPGNSGGPMLTADGKVFAIASWKVFGAAVEGIAFGVPINPGLRALSLVPGASSAESLSSGRARETRELAAESIVDTPDPDPTLDPDGDRRRAEDERRRAEEAEALRQTEADRERERRRQERIDEATPAYVKVMKWGGGALALGGLVGVVSTVTMYQPGNTTEPEFQSLRLANDLSWAAFGVGAVAFGVSFVLIPDVEDEPPKQALKLSITAGSVSLGVSYP